jgi:hypothetical protein
MTDEEWIALAERCEKATWPDREIDGTIFDALSLDLSISAEHLAKDKRLTLEWLPRYSASLDVITALIERELPEVQWLCRPDKEGGFANLYRMGNTGGVIMSWPCYAATPALALCAAFCRAMADKEPT